MYHWIASGVCVVSLKIEKFSRSKLARWECPASVLGNPDPGNVKYHRFYDRNYTASPYVMAVGCAADISRAAGDVFVTSLAVTVYSVDSANRSISQRCAVACAHASPCAEHCERSGAERTAGVTKIGLSAERQIGRSRSALSVRLTGGLNPHDFI